MITLPRKIVFVGVSKSGKSTLGDNFEKHFGHKAMAFADPLKRAAQEIFGFKSEHLWGHSELRNSVYPAFEFSGWCFECQGQCDGPERHLGGSQFYTIEASIENEQERRNDPDYWLCQCCQATYPKYVTVRLALQVLGTAFGRRFCKNLWANACFSQMTAQGSYTITDCRFYNERNISDQNGACIVLLLRGLAESTDPHPSEAEVRAMSTQTKLFHYVLDNRAGSAQDNFRKLVAGLQELEYNFTSLDKLANLRSCALVERLRYTDALAQP